MINHGVNKQIHMLYVFYVMFVIFIYFLKDTIPNLKEGIETSLQKELVHALEDCERVKTLYIETCDEKQKILNELRTYQSTGNIFYFKNNALNNIFFNSLYHSYSELR